MKEDIKETRLENGLVVLTDRMPGVRSVTLGFFYRVGARNEPGELAGITHFIEHTVFKGTARRSAIEVAIEQDRLGGALEAFTSHEETGFAIKVIDDQLEPAFDLLSDMLVDPAFDDRELESEQRVIIEEMKMTDDNPEERLGEIFGEAYFPGHPLGMPIAGSPESVRTFSSEVTKRYHAENFHAANLVIVAAGNVEHRHIDELAAKIAASQNARSSDDAGAPVPAAPIVIHQKTDLEQAHLIIATPFVAAPSDRRYAADLLVNIIGGGMSSRLWQKIREDRGLAYSVGASSAMYRDCGVFSVFAGTSPEQVDEVVDLTMAELRDVVANGVTDSELDLAKHQARAAILLSLEDSAARAAALAQSEMMLGRQVSVSETLARVEAVTKYDVVELAREFIRTEAIAFAAIGDLGHLQVNRDRFSLA